MQSQPCAAANHRGEIWLLGKRCTARERYVLISSFKISRFLCVLIHCYEKSTWECCCGTARMYKEKEKVWGVLSFLFSVETL